MEISDRLIEKEAEVLRLKKAWLAAAREFSRTATEEGWTREEIDIRRIIANYQGHKPEMMQKALDAHNAKIERAKARSRRNIEKENVTRKLRGKEPLPLPD